ARRADIPWIADAARDLLAAHAVQVVERSPSRPAPAKPAPPAPPAPPKPRPIPDVGVYGARQEPRSCSLSVSGPVSGACVRRSDIWLLRPAKSHAQLDGTIRAPAHACARAREVMWGEKERGARAGFRRAPIGVIARWPIDAYHRSTFVLALHPR